MNLLVIFSFLLSFLHRLAKCICVHLLRFGPTPRHIGFIMDGNRRFAKSSNMEIAKGHELGLMALEENLETCFQIGIRAVTVYAFSLDNFHRPKPEVDALMDLAKIHLARLTGPHGLLTKWNAKFNVPGNHEMLPSDVKEAIRNAVSATSKGDGYVFNLCLAYTSRDEMTTAIRNTVVQFLERPKDHVIVVDAEDGTLDGWREKSITAQSLSNNMHIPDHPPLDLLIRTSGVSRLSNFLLWQCHQETKILILDTFWPRLRGFAVVSMLLRWKLRTWLSGLWGV
ncbi:Decaprenyl diphosphate synthase-like protein [Aspergillus pseudotamarii]|uniref:Alkyl transferase n=1 Tax=Aspergillus pseudotamarii TaxID=132259 RepID=A0A5N6SK44_ASPPS|nr:Decaprenyl diphosphate synthase-like protein [Aspergillus pseudotamarii]KAE8135066.1 Decaprenyl diphosphate synthase-like protein [Aspergillus pseudotamarii]